MGFRNLKMLNVRAFITNKHLTINSIIHDFFYIKKPLQLYEMAFFVNF